ncbi:MAG TPA: hypothetical protein VIS74_00990 [Chthoniobacterales bacterium]
MLPSVQFSGFCPAHLQQLGGDADRDFFRLAPAAGGEKILLNEAVTPIPWRGFHGTSGFIYV